MKAKLYAGDTYSRTLTFKDEDGEVFDPTTITCVFKNPAGTTEGTLAKADLTNTDTGIYELKWDLPDDADKGTWTLTATATYTLSSLTKAYVFPFSVFTEPYGVVTVVRRLCGLDDDSLDDDLVGFMEDAKEPINLKLSEYATTPLTTVPTQIANVANYWAAGLYLQRNMAEGKTHPHVAYAEKLLREYINYTYLSGREGKVYATEYEEIDE